MLFLRIIHRLRASPGKDTGRPSARNAPEARTQHVADTGATRPEHARNAFRARQANVCPAKDRRHRKRNNMVVYSEDHTQETRRRGRIEVICGSMFSGKTEELIRRLRRAQFARQRVEIFKPAIDTRYSEGEVVSHDSHAIASTPIDSSASILLFTSEIDVVGIDEAQFFDKGLPDVCNQLADNGVRVIVAGLDMDFRGEPFGPMPALCAIADEVSKVHAICVKCGELASFSHRTVKNEKQVLLGETAEYEPLCRTCYRRAVEADRQE